MIHDAHKPHPGRIGSGLVTIQLACWLLTAAFAVFSTIAPCLAIQTTQKSGERSASAGSSDNSSGRSIKGRVMLDGRPLPDVSVTVMPVNESGEPERAISAMLSPSFTNNDGRFEEKYVAPGAYTISASAPGYVLSDWDSDRIVRRGETVTLSMIKGGVITGRVTSATGDPLVGVNVSAIRVRDRNSRPLRNAAQPSPFDFSLISAQAGWKTDDRGIYRIYGLAPGIYHVSAGGGSGSAFPGTGAAVEVPIYYPSSTPDTAADITVQTGQEATGIDIRFREMTGHTISGTVSGSTGRGVIRVMLTSDKTGTVDGVALATDNQSRGFALEGLHDGDYYLSAASQDASMMEMHQLATSEPRKITVSGADVTGVELTLERVASLSGTVAVSTLKLENQPRECKPGPKPTLEEVVLAVRKAASTEADAATTIFGLPNRSTPSASGEFTLNAVRSGLNRFDVQLPGEALYVRSIAGPPPSPKADPIDVGKLGVTVKPGDQIKGIVITVSEGAASVRGRVASVDDKTPPAILRIYLVPAEPTSAQEVLRYAESDSAPDGTFALTNLVPGKYWLIARPAPDDQRGDSDRRPLAWDTAGRMGLRFEAESVSKPLELSPCQRVSDYVVRYTPLAAPTKPTTITKKPTP